MDGGAEKTIAGSGNYAEERGKMYDKLLRVQSELKAPKSQRNSFGNYNYRSCEDILDAVKPLLLKEGLTLTISDELLLVGDRYYVKATATISDGKTFIVNESYAREEENKKGMDSSQITGAASSYARKYALNGLFLIDDTKDSDATNQHDKTNTDKTVKPKITPKAATSEKIPAWEWTPMSRSGKIAQVRAIYSHFKWNKDDIDTACRLDGLVNSSNDLTNDQVDEVQINAVNYAINQTAKKELQEEGVQID